MDHLSAAFSALADPTRRAILGRLAKGQTHVGELGKPFRMSAPAISRHLRVLEDAGLVEREVDAQRRVLHLRGEGLTAAFHWIEQYRQHWEASLDRLVDFLEQPETPRPGRRKPTAIASARSDVPRKRSTRKVR